MSQNVPVWQQSEWAGFPRLEQTLEAKVCVIGLGGSGLAAIWELLEQGKSVVGVDAGMVAGKAAGRNGGLLGAGLAKGYPALIEAIGHKAAKAWYQATLKRIAFMKQQTPETIETNGILRIISEEGEEADCARSKTALEADGFPVEWYEGPEGQGLLFPNSGQTNPMERCRSLAKQVSAKGARLFEHSPVVELLEDGVQTAQGKVVCSKIIVAVDGKLELLLPELTGKIRTLRLQMLATAPSAKRFPRPVSTRWGFEYWQQTADGVIAMGGFRDQGGEGENTPNDQPADPVQGLLEAKLRSLGVTEPITHRWAASVCYTPDYLPFADQVRPNVWAIGGYSGTGNVVGSICGREIAREALGQKSELLEMLRVRQEHLGQKGLPTQTKKPLSF